MVSVSVLHGVEERGRQHTARAGEEQKPEKPFSLPVYSLLLSLGGNRPHDTHT